MSHYLSQCREVMHYVADLDTMASESWLAALKHMYMRPYNNVEPSSVLTCKGNCVKASAGTAALSWLESTHRL